MECKLVTITILLASLFYLLKPKLGFHHLACIFLFIKNCFLNIVEFGYQWYNILIHSLVHRQLYYRIFGYEWYYCSYNCFLSIVAIGHQPNILIHYIENLSLSSGFYFHGSQCEKVKVLEQCQLSPPPGSAPPTSLPLSFLDIPWVYCVPVLGILLLWVSSLK